MRKILKSKLNGGNIITAVNTWAVALLRYTPQSLLLLVTVKLDIMIMEIIQLVNLAIIHVRDVMVLIVIIALVVINLFNIEN